ncbi:MAG TPA: retropepsin-like aspartic protease [Stellaceae bacterium]|nr:retropepsin-like aspartic protease [Stellaceae bacterium]
MRRLLITFLLALSLAPRAGAASLNAEQMAAIDKAADAFLAKAADAKKTGMVPRQSDPAVAALLDTVFDTSALNHGPLDFGDLAKLGDWLDRLNAVGAVYQSAANRAHDVGLFSAEIGRFLDAALAILQASVDCDVANSAAHPDAKPTAKDQARLSKKREDVAASLAKMIGVLRVSGVTVGWIDDRLRALSAASSSMARFLTPEQLARLRAEALRSAAQNRDKKLRLMFDRLAAALAEPPPQMAAATPAPAGNEVALEDDGHGDYAVPVRVDDTLTAKFVVDSGASFVVLPKNMVDDLTKSGAIQPGDVLGRQIYVTADGKHHKGNLLILRQLEVGGHVATNVMAGVAPERAEPLLGMSFLEKFKSWTLDNRRHVLIIAE